MKPFPKLVKALKIDPKTADSKSASKEDENLFKFQLNADSKSGVLSITPIISGEYGVILNEQAGYEQQPQLIQQIIVDEDQPPVLRVFGKTRRNQSSQGR